MLLPGFLVLIIFHYIPMYGVTLAFKDVYIGNNCTIRNSIILNDVYIGDDSYIENCIVESRDTLRPGTNYVGSEDEIRIVVEKNVRYIL